MPKQPNDNFEQWIADAVEPLRKFSAKICGEKYQNYVEDITQEAISKVLAAKRTFDPTTGRRGLQSLLFRVAQNHFLDLVRRKTMLEDPEGLLAAQMSVAPEQETPEALRIIQNAISELSPEHQTIIKLIIEGQSYKDMAQTLGVPIGTVMSRLDRARRMLRNKLHLDFKLPTPPKPRKGQGDTALTPSQHQGDLFTPDKEATKKTPGKPRDDSRGSR